MPTNQYILVSQNIYVTGYTFGKTFWNGNGRVIRPFKDFLMLKVQNLRLESIFQYKKSQTGTLNETRMLFNTFYGKQDHTFSKIYKLYNQIKPRYTSNFYVKTKDWRLASTDDVKKSANFMCCLVYADNFLNVTIFIYHIKTNTPVFRKI